jgi:hypothetical protein
MIAGLLSKYNMILRYTKVDNITPNILSFILEKIGLRLPSDVIIFLLESGRAMMKDKGYTNLSELFTDPEFIDVIKNISEEFIPTFSLDKKSEDELVHESISLEAAINCPHCKLPFMIGDAIGHG